MCDLAFDLRSGGLVVGFAGRFVLAVAGRSEAGFVVSDGDAPPGRGIGALRGQGAGGAVGAEVGLAGDAVVAGHRPHPDRAVIWAGAGLVWPGYTGTRLR